MTTQEAADLWGIKVRRVQALCDNGKVENAKRLGHIWVIPTGTLKPIDGRTKAAKTVVLQLKTQNSTNSQITTNGEKNNGY